VVRRVRHPGLLERHLRLPQRAARGVRAPGRSGPLAHAPGAASPLPVGAPPLQSVSRAARRVRARGVRAAALVPPCLPGGRRHARRPRLQLRVPVCRWPGPRGLRAPRAGGHRGLAGCQCRGGLSRPSLSSRAPASS
jgi:hypothetical protein